MVPGCYGISDVIWPGLNNTDAPFFIVYRRRAHQKTHSSMGLNQFFHRCPAYLSCCRAHLYISVARVSPVTSISCSCRRP